MLWLIGTLITGAIIGYGGRMILPGAQNIGLIKTIGVGVVSSVIVGFIFSTIGWGASIILGSLVAAVVLWFTIRQGWLKPS
ncbi:MAG: GlsB/YeaQ/YmgE family stress response membrane protein [Actinomycetia bacterium]|nr:GlsB/YeaQ/YmgE family stress response membrane protein [Actinomycetes bacterium]MCP4228256.1 GlsB/YeaQ/YmgE family stress response membrane protein [Actinomycetes bacterium]MCP5030695.1 GlsB/YeaQ/YmgE family stress response membrane protein [Actinomycetes bacterium]